MLALFDIIFKILDVAIFRSREWAFNSKPTALVSSQIGRYKLYKNHWPLQQASNLGGFFNSQAGPPEGWVWPSHRVMKKFEHPQLHHQKG